MAMTSTPTKGGPFGLTLLSMNLVGSKWIRSRLVWWFRKLCQSLRLAWGFFGLSPGKPSIPLSYLAGTVLRETTSEHFGSTILSSLTSWMSCNVSFGSLKVSGNTELLAPLSSKMLAGEAF